jgi:hypothetical protein
VSRLGFVWGLCCRQNVGNLFGVDYDAFALVEKSNLSACGLIHDSRYLGLHDLTAVEFDPDAGAYVVIHFGKYTRPPSLTVTSARGIRAHA